jgi:hypothetical protein
MTGYRRVIGLILGFWLGVQSASAAPSLQTATSLEYGEVGRGQLSETVSEESWTFSGQAGDLIMIDLRAIDMNNLDTHLTLLDAGGNTLITDDDSGERLNSRIGPLRLPSTGDYTIIAARYSGSGEYTLQVINVLTVPMLKNGKPLVGRVNPAQPTNFFTLESVPDIQDILWRLEVRDDDAYTDPVLTVYDSTGMVASTEYTETGSLDPLVPGSGETYAVVVSWNPSSVGGQYELALVNSEITLLEPGIPQTGTLDYSTFRQSHYFRGTAGQTVRLTVTVTRGDIVPMLYVTSSTDLLFSNEGIALRELSIVLDLPVDTVYVVDVADSALTADSGDYTILLEYKEN